MQLFMFRPDTGEANFGDELNAWLFPKLLKRDPSTDETTLFVGIGTYIRSDIPKFNRTIIFGAGAGYGSLPVDIEGWEFHFVRGPKTAEVLGLPKELAITDPAILVHDFVDVPKSELRWGPSYMPHWLEAQKDPKLRESVELLGMKYIDPRWPVPMVLSELKHSSVVFTAALHGAIVADAMRIPWVPIWSDSSHDFKWQDWTASMELPYEPLRPLLVGKAITEVSWIEYLSKEDVFRNRLVAVKNKLKELQ